MKDAVLIQVGIGPASELLQLTEHRHAAWAERHGMDYFPAFDPIIGRHPAWKKIDLASSALKVGYRHVVVLDADTVVRDPSADPREALEPGAQLGMVFIPGVPYLDRAPGHWQTGAIYIRTGAEVSYFLHQVWDRGGEQPDVPYWHEQATVNELLLDRGYSWVQKLSDAWNSTWCLNPCDNAFVLGFHGTHANKLQLMSDALGGET